MAQNTPTPSLDEFLTELGKGAIKFILVVATVWVLSFIVPDGNWVICKFFDTDACLPNIRIEHKGFVIGHKTLTQVDGEFSTSWRIVSRKRLEGYHLVKHSLIIIANGVYPIEMILARITSLRFDPYAPVDVIAYRIDSPLFVGSKNASAEKMELQKGLQIDASYFSGRSAFSYTESAKLGLLVAYPNSADNLGEPKLLFRVACSTCRPGFRALHYLLRPPQNE